MVVELTAHRRVAPPTENDPKTGMVNIKIAIAV